MERIEIPQFEMSNQRVISVKTSNIEIHENFLLVSQDYIKESRKDPEDKYSPWIENRVYIQGHIKKDKIQDIYFYYDGGEHIEEENRYPHFCVLIFNGTETKIVFKKASEATNCYHALTKWWVS